MRRINNLSANYLGYKDSSDWIIVVCLEWGGLKRNRGSSAAISSRTYYDKFDLGVPVFKIPSAAK